MTDTPPEENAALLTEPSLFVLRDTAVEALEPLRTFPEKFATTLGDNLATLLGESPITLGTWNQAEHADRPSILGFDDSGSLVAIVLSDATDNTKGRIASTVEWLQSLNLRDVLKMHTSVETLMDALLAQNPDELHLSLGPDRRVLLVQLLDGSDSQATFEGVSEVVQLEMFSGVDGHTILRRVQPAASAVDPTADPTAEPVDPPQPLVDETVETPAESEQVFPAVIDLTDSAEAASPVESSLAPPPAVRNTAVEGAVEPGAVSFKPGTPMRKVDLNAYLTDKTGDPETVAPGCVASGKHVLLTVVLTPTTVLESRGHYYRAIEDALVDRFREWYDGSIPKVTFHLLVETEATPDETTYVGRLKPTAWEHRSGSQTLLFRIVPRVGSELWVQLSAGEVPPIPPEVVVEDGAEPWPVVPAKEAEPVSRRRGVRRR